mgnify:CR=1 FL=1
MKKIVILGGGESGVGAALLANAKGFEVFLSDKGLLSDKYKEILSQNNIPFEEGEHTESRILDAHEVIKSPGIPDKVELIKKLHSLRIPVISEIEFASRYTKAKIIAITGSNGKTTTTLLTYHILKNAGLNIGLAGNVGESFAKQVIEDTFDYFVLELSSFQLDGMFNFKADIAVLLNITPDHLDRYEYKMKNYVDSKFRIIQNQTQNDFFIFCADDEETNNEIPNRKIAATKLAFSIKTEQNIGAYLAADQIIINTSNSIFTMSIAELALQGKHNIYNSMASGIIAKVLEIKNDTIRESLGDFKNIEHRLEHVAKIQGIEFINDSKATNVNSVWFAMETMHAPVIWIAGGVDKGNDYTMLKALVKEKVKAIVCLGKDSRKIHDAFSDDVEVIVNTFSMAEATEIAYHLGKKGDVVLLSPACASFDLFKNYEDRGQQFKEAVKEL